MERAYTRVDVQQLLGYPLQLLRLHISRKRVSVPSPATRSSCRCECFRRNRRGNPSINATHWKHVAKLAALAAEHLTTNAAVMSAPNHRELLLATITRKTHLVRHPEIGVELNLHIIEERETRQKDLSNCSSRLRITRRIELYCACRYLRRRSIQSSPPSHWARERTCIPSSFPAPRARN